VCYLRKDVHSLESITYFPLLVEQRVDSHPNKVRSDNDLLIWRLRRQVQNWELFTQVISPIIDDVHLGPLG
jgi:hypothetical protein